MKLMREWHKEREKWMKKEYEESSKQSRWLYWLDLVKPAELKKVKRIVVEELNKEGEGPPEEEEEGENAPRVEDEAGSDSTSTSTDEEQERKSAEAARNFLEEEAKKAAEVEAKKAAEEEARKAEEELEKRKEELRKKLQVRADEVVAEELQRRGMEKRSEDLLEMQQVAETRRRNQLKGRARGSKPSSSSSESTGEEEKAVEGKKKDEEMVDESNAAKGPEQEDEQMAEESKAAKEPEQEDKQMAEESEAAKDLEQEDESMSMAEAIRASYKITDETIASLLEEDKMPSIRSVMLTLEDSIQDLPTAYGAKMEKLADEFTEWTGQLQDAADRAEEDLEENGAKKDSTRNMRDLALVKKAEAEMKKVEADAEIAEADEMLKTIMIEAENLQAGKKTVRETLDSSQRISIMLKDTVEQMKSVTAENVELRSRLFQEPKKEKNPQLAMLKAMMRKRKLAGGSMTPMSGVSPSETEEGGERKKVRGEGLPVDVGTSTFEKSADTIGDYEAAATRAKAIAVGDDDGKKDERAGEPKEKKVKKPEEKKMPTKDRKGKEKKEKKDKKETKEKKEKKENKTDERPETGSTFSEKDIRDMDTKSQEDEEKMKGKKWLYGACEKS
ncbi:unnamed protein product [Symbiodinium microadriaticum]|nr:unnamed protein product [Symbiodinium microadriaticum]